MNAVWCHGKQPTFAEIAEKYGARITGEQPTAPYLILYDDTPIGYIQTYRWRDYPGYEAYVDLTNAASLDLFIGEETFRNKGLGPEILSRFLQEIVFASPDVASCIITPEARNTSAIRAYEKVGFRHMQTVPDIPDEPGPVYFMGIRRDEVVPERGALHRLTAAQYPAIAHIVRDETEFPSVSMVFQRREGEFWVDQLEAPSVVIGVLPKDTFVWGDLRIPGVKPLLVRATGLVADSPGLEPLLEETWGSFDRLPSVEYRYSGSRYDGPPLPAGYLLTSVGPEHLEPLCRYRPAYRNQHRIGDFRTYADFFAHSFGYAVFEIASGRIVSACMAHSVSDRRIDFALRTLNGHEGQEDWLEATCRVHAVRTELAPALACQSVPGLEVSSRYSLSPSEEKLVVLFDTAIRQNSRRCDATM